MADALTFAAGCSQIHHNPDVPVRVLLIIAVLVAQLFFTDPIAPNVALLQTNQSEDCLNLNVFAPARCAAGDDCNLPVQILTKDVAQFPPGARSVVVLRRVCNSGRLNGSGAHLVSRRDLP